MSQEKTSLGAPPQARRGGERESGMERRKRERNSLGGV